MKKINCLGEMCPVPMLLLQDEYVSIQEGETIMLITDHRCTLDSVTLYCEAQGFNCIPEEAIPGVWEIKITQ